MTVEEFCQKWRVTLSDDALLLIKEARFLMDSSIDPTHDQRHPEAVLANANSILEHELGLAQQINFEVLVLSILWHDVWKAQHMPRYAITLLYSFWVEALGSQKLFASSARKTQLPKQTRSQVEYAIRKHHSIQFLPRKTLEAKILKDCDELEIWSIERAQTMYAFVMHHMTGRGMKKLLRRYLHLKLKRSVKTVYFQTTSQLLQQKMRVFLREFDQEIDQF